jgi:hypothetical protein
MKKPLLSPDNFGSKMSTPGSSVFTTLFCQICQQLPLCNWIKSQVLKSLNILCKFSAMAPKEQDLLTLGHAHRMALSARQYSR